MNGVILPANAGAFASNVRNQVVNSTLNDPYAALGSAKLAADYENKLFLENDSTKYQRAYKDLLATGLNPRLLLSRGFDTNAGSSAVNYSRSESSSNSKAESFSTSALITALILGLAKILF